MPSISNYNTIANVLQEIGLIEIYKSANQLVKLLFLFFYRLEDWKLIKLIMV
jgi:hypothetical protein